MKSVLLSALVELGLLFIRVGFFFSHYVLSVHPMAQASIDDALSDIQSNVNVATSAKSGDNSSKKSSRTTGSSNLSLKDMDKRISAMESSVHASLEQIMHSLLLISLSIRVALPPRREQTQRLQEIAL